MSLFLFSIILIVGIILLQSKVLKPILELNSKGLCKANPIYLNGKQMYKRKTNRLRFSKNAKLKHR